MLCMIFLLVIHDLRRTPFVRNSTHPTESPCRVCVFSLHVFLFFSITARSPGNARIPPQGFFPGFSFGSPRTSSLSTKFCLLLYTTHEDDVNRIRKYRASRATGEQTGFPRNCTHSCLGWLASKRPPCQPVPHEKCTRRRCHYPREMHERVEMGSRIDAAEEPSHHVTTFCLL